MSEEDLKELDKILNAWDVEATIDAVKDIQGNLTEAIIKESIEDPTIYDKVWIKKLRGILR